MNNILLGIDVGKAKTGVAVAHGPLAEPIVVIHEKDINKLAGKIKNLAQGKGAEKIIVGLPEGPLARVTRGVADLLRKEGLEVFLWDETLTTKDAQKFAIEARIPQKKRQELEDAFAATLILQDYLDNSEKPL